MAQRTEYTCDICIATEWGHSVPHDWGHFEFRYFNKRWSGANRGLACGTCINQYKVPPSFWQRLMKAFIK